MSLNFINKSLFNKNNADVSMMESRINQIVSDIENLKENIGNVKDNV
jgi:hypothetical protein